MAVKLWQNISGRSSIHLWEKDSLRPCTSAPQVPCHRGTCLRSSIDFLSFSLDDLLVPLFLLIFKSKKSLSESPFHCGAQPAVSARPADSILQTEVRACLARDTHLRKLTPEAAGLFHLRDYPVKIEASKTSQECSRGPRHNETAGHRVPIVQDSQSICEAPQPATKGNPMQLASGAMEEATKADETALMLTETPKEGASEMLTSQRNSTVVQGQLALTRKHLVTTNCKDFKDGESSQDDRQCTASQETTAAEECKGAGGDDRIASEESEPCGETKAGCHSAPQLPYNLAGGSTHPEEVRAGETAVKKYEDNESKEQEGVLNIKVKQIGRDGEEGAEHVPATNMAAPFDHKDAQAPRQPERDAGLHERAQNPAFFPECTQEVGKVCQESTDDIKDCSKGGPQCASSQEAPGPRECKCAGENCIVCKDSDKCKGKLSLTCPLTHLLEPRKIVAHVPADSPTGATEEVAGGRNTIPKGGDEAEEKRDAAKNKAGKTGQKKNGSPKFAPDMAPLNHPNSKKPAPFVSSIKRDISSTATPQRAASKKASQLQAARDEGEFKVKGECRQMPKHSSGKPRNVAPTDETSVSATVSGQPAVADDGIEGSGTIQDLESSCEQMKGEVEGAPPASYTAAKMWKKRSYQDDQDDLLSQKIIFLSIAVLLWKMLPELPRGRVLPVVKRVIGGRYLLSTHGTLDKDYEVFTCWKSASDQQRLRLLSASPLRGCLSIKFPMRLISPNAKASPYVRNAALILKVK
ncbi:hypothetical protein Efla_003092 [Eimeria flavescens]